MSASTFPGMLLCDCCGIDFPEQDCTKPYTQDDEAYCPGCAQKRVMGCPYCRGFEYGCEECGYTGDVVPADFEGWDFPPSKYERRR